MIEVKENTHIVIKRDDLKYLNTKQANQVFDALAIISMHKKPNEYYICNKDEPYADQVLQVIMEGEAAKEVAE